MAEFWKPLFALLVATLTSLLGTISIRLASDSATLWLAIAGASLWSLSGAAFLYAVSQKGVELGVASALMSAGGILLINLIGIVWWGDSASDPRKWAALVLIVIAIALLARTTTNP